MAIKKYSRTVNLFDDTNIISISGLGDRYGVVLPNGTYSIYNNTNNTVYMGINNFLQRYTACEAHSTATVTLENVSGTDGGFIMALNSASQGGCTIVAGSTPPDHYIPYRDWLVHGYKRYGTETETITTLPKEIIGDGQNISAYTIKGNMSQSGTPTPSNPIYPTECGDKTANLCNGIFEQGTLSESSAIGSTYAQTKSGADSRRIRLINLVKIGGECTISVNFNKYQLYLLYYDQNGLYTGQHTSNWSSSAVTINQEYIGIAIKKLNNSEISPNENDINLMVNTGSTPLPYEPYGYKIPILLNGVEYPIYITEPLRKSLDGSNVYDTIESNGTLTRRVDANGDALATPTTEQVTVPTLTTTGTAEQFNVLTTLAPSEVSLTYHGWHDHTDTKYTSG